MWGLKRVMVVALATAAAAWAQYPPELQWRTIGTAHFDVVFPRELERDALRLANALETMYRPLSQSLGTRLPRRTTVLLANQTVTRGSGGFVSMMPRMATIQAMPSQSFWGTSDWMWSNSASPPTCVPGPTESPRSCAVARESIAVIP